MTLHNYRLACIAGTLFRDGALCELCLGRAPLPGIRHRCYRGSALGSVAVGGSLMLHRGIGSFRHVSRFLAVSEFVRRTMVRAGLPAERVQVKPNFCWDGPQRGPASGSFLYLGRLSPEKGVGTLLHAWRGGGLGELHIVGDGSQADALRAEAPAGVRFFGSVRASEVPKMLARSRALLVPSVCHEAGSRVVVEAMAARVPVIASRMGALPELLDEGRAGVLVEAGDPGAWRLGIQRLLDAEENERLGGLARRAWERRFTPGRALAVLESAYTATIDSSSSR